MMRVGNASIIGLEKTAHRLDVVALIAVNGLHSGEIAPEIVRPQEARANSGTSRRKPQQRQTLDPRTRARIHKALCHLPRVVVAAEIN